MENKFTESDKEKVVKFLNLIGKHARFDVSTNELIEVFKGLSFMQQVILPKINSNILEILSVEESEESEGEE